ncbi:MAG: transcriptional regulator [Devosia sp.]|nr:transcriptional regulator [Devosia sp.]
MRAFLDFEASSLAKDSYPIEVAWVFEDGRAEAHLIKPAAAWTDWDEGAAAIHGIPRATLIADGMPAEMVGKRVLEQLAAHTIYASSPPWDGKWLSVLLQASGLPRHALRLRDTDEIQLETALELLRLRLPTGAVDAAAKSLIEGVRNEMSSAVIAHRALPDAEHERQIWLAVRRKAEAFPIT